MIYNMITKLDIAEQTQDIFANDLLKLSGDSFGERLLFGLTVMVIGMVAVFVVLALLLGVLQMFSVVYNIKAKKTNPIEPEIVSELQPVAEIIEEISPEVEDDEEELIAVITAALSASTGKPQTEFRVVSFKRTNYGRV